MWFIPRCGTTVSSYLPFGKYFERIALGVSVKCNINGTCMDTGKKHAGVHFPKKIPVHNLGVSVSQEPFPMGKTYTWLSCFEE